MTEAVLGVDTGTSSSKGVLVAPDGVPLARADRPHRTFMPGPGRFEHDAVQGGVGGDPVERVHAPLGRRTPLGRSSHR